MNNKKIIKELIQDVLNNEQLYELRTKDKEQLKEITNFQNRLIKNNTTCTYEVINELTEKINSYHASRVDYIVEFVINYMFDN